MTPLDRRPPIFLRNSNFNSSHDTSSFFLSDVTIPSLVQQHWAMPPLRSATIIFHPAHTPSLVSPSGQSYRPRHLPGHHDTVRKRPQPLHVHSTPISFTASFTTTTRRSAKEQNHYETLGLPVTASADEIKKCVNRIRPRLPLPLPFPLTHIRQSNPRLTTYFYR